MIAIPTICNHDGTLASLRDPDGSVSSWQYNPHHLTKQGNRPQQVFFCDDDLAAHLEVMATWYGMP
jgi:YD repeat-containing protein